MIRRLAKLLPYGLVMLITKKFNARNSTLDGRAVRSWQIDHGEYVVFDSEAYYTMRKKEREAQEKKVGKERAKYEELKRKFEPEKDEDEDF